MKETHNTEGNLITFNIALKRLAKSGNTVGCEGIILGMLQNGIEPSVVSYTTAIAACVADPKKSDVAVEWVKRMRSRLVQPNVVTYNTVFASCLDGTLEGSTRASQLAAEMKADVQKQVDSGVMVMDEYTTIVPSYYTRTLAQQAMKQLKSNWEAGLIDKLVATQTLRVPLLELVKFVKSDLGALAEKQKESILMVADQEMEFVPKTVDTEDELEYATTIGSSARAAEV
jgi:pentatricopeptide repeat protein